jgi:hypothetical protein
VATAVCQAQAYLPQQWEVVTAEANYKAVTKWPHLVDLAEAKINGVVVLLVLALVVKAMLVATTTQVPNHPMPVVLAATLAQQVAVMVVLVLVQLTLPVAMTFMQVAVVVLPEQQVTHLALVDLV